MATGNIDPDRLTCPKCGEKIKVIEPQDRWDAKFECPKCGEIPSAIINP